jgi:hypothetical protein
LNYKKKPNFGEGGDNRKLYAVAADGPKPETIIITDQMAKPMEPKIDKCSTDEDVIYLSLVLQPSKHFLHGYPVA